LSHQRESGPAALVLTATVARRYYLEGATKRDIAAELGLSRFKVARLLDEARATRVVRIELDSSEALLRTTLGRAAGELVTEIVEPGDVLGIAWARALMPMRTALGAVARCDVVQLTGALSPPQDESTVELVRDVARRSAGQAYVYYAPMIVPDAATATVPRSSARSRKSPVP
jgi:DNA-binding transcriptional regulator LsrR (DeoR family)